MTPTSPRPRGAGGRRSRKRSRKGAVEEVSGKNCDFLRLLIVQQQRDGCSPLSPSSLGRLQASGCSRAPPKLHHSGASPPVSFPPWTSLSLSLLGPSSASVICRNLVFRHGQSLTNLWEIVVMCLTTLLSHRGGHKDIPADSWYRSTENGTFRLLV
jgi:hypothetical protein